MTAADAGDRVTFSFACPRCSSLLESEPRKAGQTGICPTCNAHLVMPAYDKHAYRLPTADIIDFDRQDPTPTHAYAASGNLAPRIIRLGDGVLRIECPRCGYENNVAANNCAICGVPFSTEGIHIGRPRTGELLATVSLVLGIVSLPLCFVLLPGGLAVLCGLASWLRCIRAGPPGRAIAGFSLGLVSLALGLFFLLL